MNRYEPRAMSIFATNKCNYQCWFCLRSSGKLDKVKSIDIKTVELALDKYPSIQSACLAGFGEPLLYDRLKELIDFLKSRKLIIRISTNGSLVHTRKDILKHINIAEISVSLNSINQATYEAAHKIKGDFLQVYHNINWLYEYSDSNINVSYVIHKRNYHMIKHILNSSLKCHSINLFNILPHTQDNYDLIIRQQDSKIVQFIEEQKRLPQAKKVANWPVYLNRKKEPGKCMLPFNHLLLGVDGSISCCARVTPPAVEIGTIYEDDPFNNLGCEKIRNQRTKRTECLYCFGNY